MDQQKEDDIVRGATDAVLKVGNRPLIVEANFTTWFDLIAIVQVALRHPGMKDQAPAQTHREIHPQPNRENRSGPRRIVAFAQYGIRSEV